jgi:nucleoside-diphosphate-sugar epimerase
MSLFFSLHNVLENSMLNPLQYPIVSCIIFTHLIFCLVDARPRKLREEDVGPITRKAKIVRFKPAHGRHTIVVTGGCGLLGSEIVRQLLDKNYNVKVLDLNISKKIIHPQCEYIQCDITKDDLQSLLKDTHGICHTAGVVCLNDNPNLLFNVHVVGTQRLLRAARLAGVQAFVYTSSSGAITSPYAQYSQMDMRSSFKVDSDYQFPSHYARTKYEAEQIVLGANNKDYFCTCAIRIPGMYGVFFDGTPDSILIGPLLSGAMSHVPFATFSESKPPLVDFV